MNLIVLLLIYWTVHQTADGLFLSKNLRRTEFNFQGTQDDCECQNGGTCLYKKLLPTGSFRRVDTGTCYCHRVSTGIFESSGRTCRRLKDFCTPNPCLNGGRCLNKMGYFFCVDCTSGWSGQDCSKRVTATRHWTEDFTVVWYPNSDFQVTSISWIRLSFSQAGSPPLEIFLEYFGIVIPIREDFPQQLFVPDSVEDCYEMLSEDVVCNTYRNGTNYFTMVLNAQNNFFAAPYNLIFGSHLENALTAKDPKWPYEMFAVKYQIKLHVYSNRELLMPVTSLNVWHQVTSTYSACLPLISFDGCDTSVKYPTKYLAHELVTLQLISQRQNNSICKNLIVELREAVTFFRYDADDKSDLSKRAVKDFDVLTQTKWQDNVKLKFEQQKKYFFGFNSFWIVTFPLALYGSYVSTTGRDLYMELNAMCFIRIEPPRTVVTVEGGDRIVDCTKPVEFTPVSSGTAFDVSLFTLKWSCVDESDGENPICEPKTTKWGPYKYNHLNCDRRFKFKLEHFHKYYNSTALSQAGKPYEFTITTEVASTEIRVICWSRCDKVNPIDGVLVEAIESPLSAYVPPEWALYEGSAAGVKLPLREYRSTTGDPWLVSIKRNVLKPGTTYAIEARTTKGRGSKEFKTNSPPENGTCEIVPQSGIRGVTMFQITCRNWKDEDSPLLYTFGINENDSFEPLAESYYEDNLPSTVLFYNNVSVQVTDMYKLKTVYPLTVKLTNGITTYDFTEDQRSFSSEYRRNDFVAMTSRVVKNSKMSLVKPDFPLYWKVEILRNILTTLPHVKYYNSIHQMVGSMLRLMKQAEDGKCKEDGVQNIILGVGEGLELAAQRLKERVLEDDSYTMWDSQIHGIVSAILTTADAAFKAQDPVLLASSEARDGIQEIHRQKAKYGVWYVLRSLHTVMEIARSTMVLKNQRPYIFKHGGITIFTAVGHGVTLHGYLKELANDGSAVLLSSKAIESLGLSTYAVEVIRSENYAYHAWKPIVGQVLQIKFLKGSPGALNPQEKIFEEDKLSKGLFMLRIRMGPTLLSRDVRGQVVHPERTVTYYNRYVSLSQFQLPTGYGGVIVRIDRKHFGKIKMVMAQGRRPSYSDVNMTSPVDRYWNEVKFHNKVPTEDSNFYIGFISNGEPVHNYVAQVTVVRCVIYVSDEWEAQKCKYMSLHEEKGQLTALCRCSHLSTISSDFVLPDSRIEIQDNVLIFATIWDNFYVASVMIFILLSYFILLIWGKRNDAKDDRTRSVINLVDNYPGDVHPYVIAIWTGKRCRAGTSSKVAIQVVGTGGRTRPHILRSPYRSVLGMASDDWFLMYTDKYLDEIKEILVWHSSSGCRPDWYCNQITVYDLKTQTPYNFVVDRWFTINRDLDESKLWFGTLSQKGVWITEPEDNVGKLVADHFFAGVREKHRWTSIFTRHPRSLYTRCERIAVLGTMLISTMLTSIMFFGQGDFGAADLPFAYMSLEDILVSLQSMLIGSVLSFLTLYAFNKGKRKPKAKNTVTEKEMVQEELMKDKLSKVKMGWIMKWYDQAKKNLPITYLPIVDEQALRDQIKAEKFNYFLMLAWVVSTLFLISMSVGVVWYGLRFGKKRSLLWIQAFISGTLLDAFFLDPFKMALLALLTAVIFKRSSIGDVVVLVEYDQTNLPFNNFMTRLNSMWKRLGPEYKPMAYRRIRRLYNHRQRMNIVRRYLLYMFILTLLVLCAYKLVDSLNTKSRYLSNLHLKEFFTVSGAEYAVNSKDIHTSDQLNNYTLETLLGALHKTKWYNGQLLKPESSEPGDINVSKVESEWKGWCMDYSTKLQGVPRIRQQRLSLTNLSTKTTSSYFKKFRNTGNLTGYFKNPFGFLNLINEDYRTYLVGWEPYNKKEDGNVTNVWKHFQIHSTETDIYKGESGISYPGHGYVKFLYWTRGESEKRYNALIMNKWFDNRTRAAFVEVNLYNINLNMFTSFVILAERLPSNVYVVRPLIDTAALTTDADPVGSIELSVSFMLIILVAVYSSYWVVESSRVGILASAATWRGFADFACILFAIVQVYQNIAKAVRFSAFPDRLDRTPRDVFVALYAPFYNDFKVKFCLGIFSLLVMSTYATAVHHLIGLRWFGRSVGHIVRIIVPFVVIGIVGCLLISVMMKLGGEGLNRFLLFDIVLNETPYRELRKASMPVQFILVICYPAALILKKIILATVIGYILRSERMAPPITGIIVGKSGKTYTMNLKDQTHDIHEKNIRAQILVIDKKMLMLQKKMDKRREKWLKAEKKAEVKARKKMEKAELKAQKKAEKIAAKRRKGGQVVDVAVIKAEIDAEELMKVEKAEAKARLKAQKAEEQARKAAEKSEKAEALARLKAEKAEAGARLKAEEDPRKAAEKTENAEADASLKDEKPEADASLKAEEDAQKVAEKTEKAEADFPLKAETAEEDARLKAEKAEADARLNAEKAEVNARLKAEKAEADARLNAEKAEVGARLKAEKIEKAEASARLKAEKGEENARLKAEKAEANARLKAEKAEVNARMKAEKAEAEARMKAEKAEVDARMKAEKAEAKARKAAEKSEKAEAVARLKAEKAEEDARLKAEKAEVNARMKSEKAEKTEADARLKAEKIEADARLKAEKAEVNARMKGIKAEEDARLKAEKAEADARLKAEKAEASARMKGIKAEEDARLKAEMAEADARLKAEKAEADALVKAEKAEADARMKTEKAVVDARMKAEKAEKTEADARLKAEAEALKKYNKLRIEPDTKDERRSTGREAKPEATAGAEAKTAPESDKKVRKKEGQAGMEAEVDPEGRRRERRGEGKVELEPEGRRREPRDREAKAWSGEGKAEAESDSKIDVEGRRRERRGEVKVEAEPETRRGREGKRVETESETRLRKEGRSEGKEESERGRREGRIEGRRRERLEGEVKSDEAVSRRKEGRDAKGETEARRRDRPDAKAGTAPRTKDLKPEDRSETKLEAKAEPPRRRRDVKPEARPETKPEAEPEPPLRRRNREIRPEPETETPRRRRDEKPEAKPDDEPEPPLRRRNREIRPEPETETPRRRRDEKPEAKPDDEPEPPLRRRNREIRPEPETETPRRRRDEKPEAKPDDEPEPPLRRRNREIRPEPETDTPRRRRAARPEPGGSKKQGESSRK